jgi:glycine cleavage system aminomethyltransferase T
VTDNAPAAYLKVPRDQPERRQPVMRSIAHRLHASMGAVFEDRGTWQVPALYGSEEGEAEAMRSTVGYADVSAQGKVHVMGSVDSSIRFLTAGTLSPMRAGAVIAGGVVARPARDWALVLTPPSQEREALARLEGDEAGGGMMATDMTSAMSGFIVAGPNLDGFLARSLNLDRADLQPGRCVATSWAKIPAVVVVTELGGRAVELYVGSEFGRYAWETLRAMCGRLGGSPVGWLALESLGWRK